MSNPTPQKATCFGRIVQFVVSGFMLMLVWTFVSQFVPGDDSSPTEPARSEEVLTVVEQPAQPQATEQSQTASDVDAPLLVPTATPVEAEAAASNIVTVQSGANLRGGPGTDYAVVGGAAAGDALTVVGQNGDGTWLQLENGAWIAAFLVSGIADAAPSSGAGTAVSAPVIERAAEPIPVVVPSTSSGQAEPAAQQPQSSQVCDASYPDFCLQPGIDDLDCGDIPQRRFRVLPPDPHDFDGNPKDGIGCESD
jgi:uncharacterized protein YraI